MDYTALFDKSEDQIVFNENEVQLVNANYKRKVLYGLVVFLVLICVVIFCVWILMKPAENYLLCSNSTIKNCNFTLVENESKLDSKLEGKHQFVKQMMIEAWNEYERYDIYGTSERRRRSVSANDIYVKDPTSSASIIAAMSTLWTMGLKKEFEWGKKWIETKLDLSKVNRYVRVFDVETQYIGGLLSCYALTNEQLFMNKALTIAQLVEPAFNTEKGFPRQYINLENRESPEFTSYLTYVSGLDYNYLSDVFGKEKYRKQIRRIQNILKKMDKPKNLYLIYVYFDGKWGSDWSSLFIESREFYISLVKSYIQSNHLDVQSIEMYKEAMDAVEAVKMFEVSNGGLYYTRGYDQWNNKFDRYMRYSGCYLGAMLSLGASAMQRALALNSSIGDNYKVTQQNRINRHWHLAIQITRTCQLASDRTKTGLGPEQFYFNETYDVIPKWNFYSLSPELAESNFILWRLTHNETYRDNAWRMAQAIDHHCRVNGSGYAWIEDVYGVPTRKFDQQQAHFLSATLKYLYLTFSNDSVLSLDQYVFNSAGHPLPICVNNTMYPKELCSH